MNWIPSCKLCATLLVVFVPIYLFALYYAVSNAYIDATLSPYQRALAKYDPIYARDCGLVR